MRIGVSKNVGKGVRVYGSKNVGGKGSGSGCLTVVIIFIALCIAGIFSGGDKDEDKKPERSTQQTEQVQVQTDKQDPPQQDQQAGEKPSTTQPLTPTGDSDKDTTRTPDRTTPQTQTPAGKTVVGSKESDKYHVPTCRWAKKIEPENLIKWNSAAEAKAAGYSPCGTCHP